MSKKKRKSRTTTNSKSTPHGGFTSAERRTHGMPPKAAIDKMSGKIEAMASALLVRPASSNPVVVQAAVSLAQIAWNRANTHVDNHETDEKLLAHVQQMISSVFRAPLKKELREINVDLAVERLVQYKKKHFADDPREILAAMLHPDDDVKSDFDARIRVHWTYPNAEQMRQILTPSGIVDFAKKLESNALAQKIASEVSQFRQNKVVDTNCWKTGKMSAEAFQPLGTTKAISLLPSIQHNC